MLTLLLLAADFEFRRVEDSDGVLVEARAVEGSGFSELRLTAFSARSVDALCDELFGTGKLDPEQPDVTSRKVSPPARKGPTSTGITGDQVPTPCGAG